MLNTYHWNALEQHDEIRIACHPTCGKSPNSVRLDKEKLSITLFTLLRFRCQFCRRSLFEIHAFRIWIDTRATDLTTPHRVVHRRAVGDRPTACPFETIELVFLIETFISPGGCTDDRRASHSTAFVFEFALNLWQSQKKQPAFEPRPIGYNSAGI
jgi:hypothetical protein